MAICELHFDNDNVLAKSTSAMVILPKTGIGPFPVLYLLHGLSDDHTAWTRRTSLERYVGNVPLIIVMPNGDRSFYCDSLAKAADAYETYLTTELIDFIDTRFQTIPTRAGRATAGLSMGGYGALSLALKHPDLYCAAASLSGAVHFGHHAIDAESARGREFGAILGPQPQGGPNDLYAVIEKSDPETRPALRIDCGLDDFLIEDNRAFHTFLSENEVPHEYVEYPGAHNWEYWDEHIQDVLTFACKALNLNSPEAENADAPMLTAVDMTPTAKQGNAVRKNAWTFTPITAKGISEHNRCIAMKRWNL